MGPKSVAIGYYAGRAPANITGPVYTSSFVAIGTCAGFDTTYAGGCVAIGNNAGTGLHTTLSGDQASIAIGNHAAGGPTIDPDSPSPPVTVEALGGSISIGSYAAAAGAVNDMISIGRDANVANAFGGRANAVGSIAIGAETLADSGDNCIVIGFNNKLSATSQAMPSVLIGNNMNVVTQLGDASSVDAVHGGFYTNVIRRLVRDEYNSGSYVCVYASTTNSSNEFEITAQQAETQLIAVGTSLSFPGPVLNTTNITYKTFVVDHPKKPDNYLVHACLEGPEAGVYYRGKAYIRDTFVEVELPDYVDALATNFTVHITPIFNGTLRIANATEIKDNKFRIYGNPGDVHWAVYGTRGSIEVEPLKQTTKVNGDGPYKWI